VHISGRPFKYYSIPASPSRPKTSIGCKMNLSRRSSPTPWRPGRRRRSSAKTAGASVYQFGAFGTRKELKALTPW